MATSNAARKLERQAARLAGQIQQQEGRVGKMKGMWEAARTRLVQLVDELKGIRTQLAEARKSTPATASSGMGGKGNGGGGGGGKGGGARAKTATARTTAGAGAS